MNTHLIVFIMNICIVLTQMSATCIQAEPARRNETARPNPHYTIIEQASHSTSSFTQGFLIKDTIFYESSGLYNRSYISRYASDKPSEKLTTPLSRQYFAEGLTLLGDELFVLTWKENELLVFDSTNLKYKRSLSYSGQGWGLTHNDEGFIMSNGSHTLTIRDKKNFSILRKMRVAYGNTSFKYLNELEFAQDHIWANVWQSHLILKIHPKSGQIINRYDLSAISQQNNVKPGHSVLNGIAYDEEKDAFWITGKLWPSRYLIRFKATQTPPQKIVLP